MVLVGNLKERNYFRDTGVDGRIILKLMFNGLFWEGWD
jgi:hypothetical protein